MATRAPAYAGQAGTGTKGGGGQEGPSLGHCFVPHAFAAAQLPLHVVVAIHLVAAARLLLLQEHGVNGQDLLCMTEEDMEDGRFKFPKNVQRKVGRVGLALV